MRLTVPALITRFVLVLQFASEERPRKCTDQTVTRFVAAVVSSRSTSQSAHQATIALLRIVRVCCAVLRLAVRVVRVGWVWLLVVRALLRELARRG